MPRANTQGATPSNVATTPEKTIIVTFKNKLLIGTPDNMKAVPDVKSADIPKNADVTFYINTQWLSKDNRIKVETLAEGHTVVNNTLDPKIVGDMTEYFKLVQVAKKTSRSKAIPMSEEHKAQLKMLLDTYNKATLSRQIIVLSLDL